jgi:hypothetical protein
MADHQVSRARSTFLRLLPAFFTARFTIFLDLPVS